MKKIKVDIFSGFLGAGKTMLIKKLITEKLNTEKIVIIENEFGEIGIDGSILKETNIEVKEINAGCICCTIVNDFTNAIKEIVEKFNPDRIIIEPSGVAKLSEILETCRNSELKELISINMLMTVLDILKFDTYIQNFSSFYKNQISNAKTIILSRTQFSSNENILNIVNKIKKFNPNASIITTPWENITADQIMEVTKEHSDNIIKKFNLLKMPKGATKIKRATTETNETFQFCGIETPKLFSERLLKKIFNKLQNESSLGYILRAKGIVQATSGKWIQFNYVPNELTFDNCSPEYTSLICVIGSNLNKSAIKDLFLKQGLI
ncbi:GTP-binding protein [Clostridium botulinum]|uniref:Cobalamin biosynthesis protein CobW n=1 Tax=Clostridium botulinum C/D str. DC5 TaxID=1443128 RepID=A0A0A0IKT4_CLOBO|nr:CobW family GTP-binding protein [Clostridium botulinum]KEI00761.1 cobalamin biosynthesis protein CobW [Clostridium botulinum C/D str. BKT75002]KEI11699.1 cobalamin biosynthesis protein CobW [Clostridium botulinum C/D str. BKT2873]KGM94110.1 cobalamin biosynthesis protein CobW [Clostridium botulinum D str. CCUG 7971]KGN00186.1 cobalamin biosynthesis protein CobW [Clostridium botulinum C/D str. DC5]KOC50850.1 cobalamin biosynthesis protein CobW [Clostridium botulinum]